MKGIYKKSDLPTDYNLHVKGQNEWFNRMQRESNY